jgi:hypothetical protein
VRGGEGGERKNFARLFGILSDFRVKFPKFLSTGGAVLKIYGNFKNFLFISRIFDYYLLIFLTYFLLLNFFHLFAQLSNLRL